MVGPQDTYNAGPNVNEVIGPNSGTNILTTTHMKTFIDHLGSARLPCEAYYERLTCDKAFAHVHGQSARSSAPSGVVAAEAPQSSGPSGVVAAEAPQSSGPAPSGVVAAEAPLTKADVQGMIQAALAQQFPAKTQTSKVCSTCGVSKERGSFSATNWNKSNAVCLACKPIDPALQKRLLHGKICANCNVEKDRSLFSKTQWQAGKASKCMQCVAESVGSATLRSKVCITCNAAPCIQEFTSLLNCFSHFVGPYAFWGC